MIYRVTGLAAICANSRFWQKCVFLFLSMLCDSFSCLLSDSVKTLDVLILFPIRDADQIVNDLDHTELFERLERELHNSKRSVELRREKLLCVRYLFREIHETAVVYVASENEKLEPDHDDRVAVRHLLYLSDLAIVEDVC